MVEKKRVLTRPGGETKREFIARIKKELFGIDQTGQVDADQRTPKRVQRVGDQPVIADDASESVVVVSMAGARKLRSALAYYEVQFARDTARGEGRGVKVRRSNRYYAAPGDGAHHEAGLNHHRIMSHRGRNL